MREGKAEGARDAGSGNKEVCAGLEGSKTREEDTWRRSMGRRRERTIKKRRVGGRSTILYNV